MSYSYLNDIPDQTIDGKLIPLYPPGPTIASLLKISIF